MKEKDDNREIILRGIAASPGICIGKAYVLNKDFSDIIKKNMLSEQDLDNELIRFKKAVKQTEESLKKIVMEASSKTQASIIETHIALIKDKHFYDKVIEIIKFEKVHAEWALKKVAAFLKERFQSMESSFLQERSEDISHVCEKIIKKLTGTESVSIASIDKRVILVAKNLSPAETSQIQLEKIKGFITDTGGKTSHTGIIARALEIPAVMGLKNASDIIKNNQLIIVDGIQGIVIANPTEESLAAYNEEEEKYNSHMAFLARKSSLPCVTKDGVTVEILGNIDLHEEVLSVLKYGGSGIGLFRTEFHYMRKENSFPSEKELFESYKDIAEVMSPKSVTIRTLDINMDKNLPYESFIKEANPALGLRAIRYCLNNRDIFKTQLRAILRASYYGNIKIMFPMITCIDEIIEAKKILNEAALSLKKEDIPYKKDIKIGIMIEVPSAVIIADILAEEVDFFSIGTNDLIQYALAIDRGNSAVAHLFSPLHPAIIRMINNVSVIAKQKGVKIFMCGEMASDPLCMPLLLGMEIDGFSMNPQSIPIIKDVMRNLELKDSKKFLKKVLTLKNVQKIMELIKKTYPWLTTL